MKDVLGNHLMDLLFHLVHWLSITLLLRRISPESINLERKSYMDCSSDTFCAGGIWKGDILVADVEELETMDASEISSEKLNAQEVIFPKENRKFVFPAAGGRIKLSGGDQEPRTTHFDTGAPNCVPSNVQFSHHVVLCLKTTKQ